MLVHRTPRRSGTPRSSRDQSDRRRQLQKRLSRLPHWCPVCAAGLHARGPDGGLAARVWAPALASPRGQHSAAESRIDSTREESRLSPRRLLAALPQDCGPVAGTRAPGALLGGGGGGGWVSLANGRTKEKRST